SARMMAGVGFAALATSSGASAGLLGRRDGRVTRDEALAQAARVICDATDLPVSADLEKGFGGAPIDRNYGPALALAAACPIQFVNYSWAEDPETARGKAVDLARRDCKPSATMRAELPAQQWSLLSSARTSVR